MLTLSLSELLALTFGAMSATGQAVYLRKPASLTRFLGRR